MRWLRRVAGLSVGVPAVLAGAVVGYLTNIVSSGSSTRPVVAGLAVAVVVAAALSIWQEARAQRQQTAQLRDRRSEVLLPFAPARPRDGQHTLVSLLAARNAIAPFVETEPAMTELLDWCRNGSGTSVRLLAGPGGVGKSRLAGKLAESLPPEWAAGYVDADRLGEVGRLVDACGDPALVVVDDADVVDQLPRRLPSLLGAPDRSGPAIRVLLVVRDAEAFHSWLSAGLLDEASTMRWPVTALTERGDDIDRRQWFFRALRAYAAALGAPLSNRTVAGVVEVGVDGEPMVVTQLRAALAAYGGATRAAIDAVRTLGTDTLASAVLDHETRRWSRIAADRRWGLPTELTASARESAVLALVAAGPRTADDAAAIVRRLALVPDEHGANLVTWARYLYPTALGPTSPVVAPVPQLLAACLISRLADERHRPLVDRLRLGELATADPAVLERLVRAASTFPAACPLLDAALDGAPDLLESAIEIVFRAGRIAYDIESVLAPRVCADRLDAEQVARLQNLIDAPGSLRIAVALSRAAVEHARDGGTRRRMDLAVELTHVASLLSAAAEQEPARAAGEEAVSILREGAETDAAARRQLAWALSALAIISQRSGRRQDAVMFSEEAVRHHRVLAADSVEPAPELAEELTDLGEYLSESGRQRLAIERVREAVAIFRALAEQDPARWQLELGASLSTLGRGLARNGASQAALAATEEAIRVLRALDSDHGSDHAAPLAIALTNLSAQLIDLDRPDDGLGPAEEAVTILRELAGSAPVHRSMNLYRALNNLSRCQFARGDRIPGVITTREAVSILRRSAAVEPAVYEADLGMVLTNLGLSLGAVGEVPAALSDTREGVDILRRWVAAEPGSYDVDLARGLLSFATVRLAASEELDDAVDAAAEASRIVSTVNESGGAFTDLGRRCAALHARIHAARGRAGQPGARAGAADSDPGALPAR